jgi:hypothetical protein
VEYKLKIKGGMCRVGVEYGSGKEGLGEGKNLGHGCIRFTGEVLDCLTKKKEE